MEYGVIICDFKLIPDTVLLVGSACCISKEIFEDKDVFERVKQELLANGLLLKKDLEGCNDVLDLLLESLPLKIIEGNDFVGLCFGAKSFVSDSMVCKCKDFEAFLLYIFPLLFSHGSVITTLDFSGLSSHLTQFWYTEQGVIESHLDRDWHIKRGKASCEPFV